ncbi:hypothetical protein Daura_46450 [Dactylosporangium aurantiacum]|uniref:Uncharacterized protein n=1 Tax=Dactylosporangium aurantiacum TaxID=35754 RepID=A0A9Q9MIN9_9ACTN|nr:hypothetical protein [Dactylosporangium aurantiacum]MDG6108142.1 hypothetical protein [Dactylosporangium aurantiacum]UWZ53861.1 hypothetical protein Daura_46450 [Dactylosporangium aurantiacum]
MPGSLKNKAISVSLGLLAAYFVITNPTGSAHAVTVVVKGVMAFLAALAG